MKEGSWRPRKSLLTFVSWIRLSRRKESETSVSSVPSEASSQHTASRQESEFAVSDTYTPMAYTYSVAGKNLEVSRRMSGRIQV